MAGVDIVNLTLPHDMERKYNAVLDHPSFADLSVLDPLVDSRVASRISKQTRDPRDINAAAPPPR